MVAQLSELTKNHQLVHFQMGDFYGMYIVPRYFKLSNNMQTSNPELHTPYPNHFPITQQCKSILYYLKPDQALLSRVLR